MQIVHPMQMYSLPTPSARAIASAVTKAANAAAGAGAGGAGVGPLALRFLQPASPRDNHSSSPMPRRDLPSPSHGMLNGGGGGSSSSLSLGPGPGPAKMSAKAYALMHGKTLRQQRPLDLASMLRTNIGYRFMLIQCYREYSEENVLAFKLIDAFAKKPTLAGLSAFVAKYVQPGADLMVNLSSPVRKAILDFLQQYNLRTCHGRLPLPVHSSAGADQQVQLGDALLGAQKELLGLLERDSFKRFQLSLLYVAYVSGAQPPTVLKRGGDVDERDDLALIATVNSAYGAKAQAALKK